MFDLAMLLCRLCSSPNCDCCWVYAVSNQKLGAAQLPTAFRPSCHSAVMREQRWRVLKNSSVELQAEIDYRPVLCTLWFNWSLSLRDQAPGSAGTDSSSVYRDWRKQMGIIISIESYKPSFTGFAYSWWGIWSLNPEGPWGKKLFTYNNIFPIL